MKLDDPELLDSLAAEYVTGTLRGGARRRFERYRSSQWHIAQRVKAWEDRLLPLAFGVPPVTPSPDVWRAIERRTGVGGRRPWRAIAAALVLFAVLGGGVLLWRAMIQPSLAPVATIAAADAAPIWQIEVDAEYRRLRAIIVGEAPERAADRAFELWALPEEGAPVSLGLLPVTGRVDRALSAAQARALRAAPQVAVSLEPAGGSPTGLPTGPVLFVAERQTPG